MTGILDALLEEVRACRLCADRLPHDPRPVLRASETARVLLVGQAPGARVHASGVPWDDASGDRLREWLEIDRLRFYDESLVAIMPIGFCYPGTRPGGGDLPPARICAPHWHHQLAACLDNITLTVLIGRYAHLHYLGARSRPTVTGTVREWQEYLPEYIVLPHPSWRTLSWQANNPWFDEELLPAAREWIARLTGSQPGCSR